MRSNELTGPFTNHMTIAIKGWSRARAREILDRALKVPAHEMEHFLAELLTDSLITFDQTYNFAMNEYVADLERLLHDALGVKLAPSVYIHATKGKGEFKP